MYYIWQILFIIKFFLYLKINYLKKKIKFLYYIVPIVAFIGGIWNGQFINDGYHWGFIFSNSLELLNGKKPFEEIFIQYGLGTTLIHSFVLLLFEKTKELR